MKTLISFLFIFLYIFSIDAKQSDDKNSDALLESIVVTADLREDTTQRDIATSITVLDDEVLEAAGQQHFQDVIELVPNLNWSGGSNRPRYFQIRGIGERSQYEGAPNPSVGILVDDIDFSAIGGVATLFDVEQIEVLRGPQGTRYGANALAGLIYVKSKDPSIDPAYSIKSLIGDDGDRSIGFSATGGLGKSDSAAYRVSLQSFQADGFRSNDFLNRDDSNGRDELTARAKFHFEPTENWISDMTVLYANIDNGYDAFSPENTFVVHSDKPGKDAQKSVGFAWRNQFSMNRSFDVLSISSYSDSDIDYSFDGDWGNENYWGEFSPYDFTSETDRERQHLAQEVRFISRPDQRIFGGSTDWLIGVYSMQMQEDNTILELFNGDVYKTLSSEFDAVNLAVFFQLDTHFNDNTVFSSGLRYEYRDTEYQDSSGLDLSPTDHMWGGQISINHQFSDSHNVYSTISRGYKAGGFNLSLSVPVERREYNPEFLWNIEAGIKGIFLDGVWSDSLSVFYSRREDMQVSTSYQSDPNDPLTFVFFTGNAAEGKNYGLEYEFKYQLNPYFSLYGSLGLLKAEFSEFVTAEGSIAGRDQAHAPRYQYHFGGEYRSSGGLFARMDINGSDAFFFSDSHNQKAKAHNLVNIKLGYDADNWAAYLWGRNVFDKSYAVRGFFFGLEPPDYADKQYVQLGDPSHFGISAEFNF